MICFVLGRRRRLVESWRLTTLPVRFTSDDSAGTTTTSTTSSSSSIFSSIFPSLRTRLFLLDAIDYLPSCPSCCTSCFLLWLRRLVGPFFLHLEVLLSIPSPFYSIHLNLCPSFRRIQSPALLISERETTQRPNAEQDASVLRRLL